MAICVIYISIKNGIIVCTTMGFPGGSVVKNLSANTGDAGSIPGLGDSLEKEMATHYSILVWEIPWTESLAGYSPWDHERVGRLSD